MICTDRKTVHPDDKISCLNKPLCRHILFLYMLYKIFAFSMCMLLHTLFLLSYIPFYSTGFFWFILFWRNKVNGMILEKYSWVTKYVTDPPIYHLLKNYQKKKSIKYFSMKRKIWVLLSTVHHLAITILTKCERQVVEMPIDIGMQVSTLNPY